MYLCMYVYIYCCFHPNLDQYGICKWVGFKVQNLLDRTVPRLGGNCVDTNMCIYEYKYIYTYRHIFINIYIYNIYINIYI